MEGLWRDLRWNSDYMMGLQYQNRGFNITLINFYNAGASALRGAGVGELDGRLSALMEQKQGAVTAITLIAGDFNCRLCPNLLPIREE